MLKKRLRDNKLSIGSWITIGHPAIAEIMAKAGFDWLVIDMEHTSIDFLTAQVLITIIQGYGLDALVRVAKNDEVEIKKALDIGADGVIVPMINSKEDAQKAVSFTKYPPQGSRGVGLFRAQGYGYSFEDYRQWLKDNIVIIAQIEHLDAVNNIEDIISTDGIDGVIIGPYDLSGSMGYPGQYERYDVKRAIESVISSCKNKDFPVGFHVIETEPKKFIEKAKMGCSLLVYSVDFFFLGDKAREGIMAIKEVFGSD